ncbi:MAG: antibiotic biosynthesis monooxygenase [Dehalococcoidia bacterium]|nr:antibiotic biosynthesis monooxygenase [Dehalococcoidia bacterium]
MAVKVIIERSVLPDNQAEVAEFLKDLRALAVRQPGYVSGETLFSVDRPGTHVVISTWENLREWKAWEKDLRRIELAGKIDRLLQFPARTAVFATTPRSIAEGV